MNKIKIAFAALAAVAGIGGAYAATQGESSARVLTYNWYTPAGTPFSVSQTTVAAANASGCKGTSVTCLKGTNVAKQQAPVTLFKF
ncbi:hypothetical protein [Chitinophaga varians]|uniref:hypothetical protein n=1 Tax=Chitinophaga varians TaxID=2202339 RepID=UPI00165ED387|nr:hypothetical protein [Chitinophaga varians]MBC9915552.1 hypothetical protein [Chitinophaga varians]